MHSTSIFHCMMTMISNFTIFFVFHIFILIFFLQIKHIFAFSYDSYCSFVSNFIFFLFKINYLHCVPLHTSCLFSIFLNEDIVVIEKLDAKCSLTFVVDEFSGLFLYSSVFAIIHSRSA